MVSHEHVQLLTRMSPNDRQTKRKGAKEPIIVPVPEQAGARLETVRGSFNKR